MKIALIGNGKMADSLKSLVEPSGHQIVIALDSKSNPNIGETFAGAWVDQTDVLIDFSVPEVAVGNILRACRTGLPIVQGTTGWYDQLEWLRRKVHELGGSCVYSSNFSLGMQLFFRVITEVAHLMAPFDSYAPYLVEHHHRTKQDSPSGSALRLLSILSKDFPDDIPTGVLRAGSIPGTHEVGFDSPEECLTFRHTARNRDGFARGALLAVELILGKRGFFEFQEILFDDQDQLQ